MPHSCSVPSRTPKRIYRRGHELRLLCTGVTWMVASRITLISFSLPYLVPFCFARVGPLRVRMSAFVFASSILPNVSGRHHYPRSVCLCVCHTYLLNDSFLFFFLPLAFSCGGTKLTYAAATGTQLERRRCLCV